MIATMLHLTPLLPQHRYWFVCVISVPASLEGIQRSESAEQLRRHSIAIPGITHQNKQQPPTCN